MKTKIIIVYSCLFLLIPYYSISQIVYKQFNPPVNYKNLTIDFNNDGKLEIGFSEILSKSGSGCISSSISQAILLLASDSTYIFYDKKSGNLALFGNGDTIKNDIKYKIQNCQRVDNPVLYFCSSIVSMSITNLNCVSTTNYYGLIDNFRGKYFAIKFPIKGKYHFGWIKISKDPLIDLTIEAYAYDTEPADSLVLDDLNPTQVKTFTNNNFQIFPNPLTNYLTIDFHSEMEGLLKITDLNGKERIKTRLDRVNKINMDLSGLDKGIYLIIIETKNDINVSKIVKL